MTSLQIESIQSSAEKPVSQVTVESETVESETVESEIDAFAPEYRPVSLAPKILKSAIRRSLKASTLDGAFSSIFENIAKGVLVSNFLMGLGAGAFEVGLLTSIPMLAQLLQPVGAYLSEKTRSRHAYCLWIFGAARLLWLIPAGGIFMFSHDLLTARSLCLITLGVLSASNILEAIGGASWMSWMAAIVPGKLRGRYFGLRRSLSSLTALLTIPLGGWLVSQWLGGEIEGYGIALIIAVVMGLISLGFQSYMSDVNPQTAKPPAQPALEPALEPAIKSLTAAVSELEAPAIAPSLTPSLTPSLKCRNFLILLLFLGVWTFSVNLSAPFFNFYLLDSLHLDVQWVTLYNSLRFGAFFLAIILWGRLADRIGNRPVLLLNCLLASTLPWMWSYVDGSVAALWLALPLLHFAQGSTFAALDLCIANIQLELAPRAQQSAGFARAAAIMGVAGALGTTAGGYLAELAAVGLPALFALTAIVQFISIVPLCFVREERAQSLRQLIDPPWQRWTQIWQPTRIKA
jgi:MFS family permease